MGKPDEKLIREAAKDYQKDKGEKPDNSRDFSRAGHDARDDAAETDWKVRDYKGPDENTSKK
jgi:hypothetical protein